jgi:hypothetical protein
MPKDQFNYANESDEKKVIHNPIAIGHLSLFFLLIYVFYTAQETV